jgi:hypothetical protein
MPVVINIIIMNIIIETYNKGYRVIEGNLYNPKGILIKGYIDNGYRCTKIRYNSIPVRLQFHRLLAYQKYRDEMFEEGIEVRHLDGDSLNNLDDNIAIGTHQENMMDIPKQKRIDNASNRKYDYEAVRSYYQETKSYKNTMKLFGITSKGTLNYILHECSKVAKW